MLTISKLAVITIIMSLTVISLVFFEDKQTFESLKDLILCVNKHAGERGYAIVLTCTKKLKLKVIQKAWLIYNQRGRIRGLQGQEKRHISSRANKYSFSLIAKRFDSNTDPWLLKIANAEHNHKPTLAGAHSVHRKVTLNERARANISHALTIQSTTSQILSSFCLSDSTTGMDDNYKNS